MVIPVDLCVTAGVGWYIVAVMTTPLFGERRSLRGSSSSLQRLTCRLSTLDIPVLRVTRVFVAGSIMSILTLCIRVGSVMVRVPALLSLLSTDFYFLTVLVQGDTKVLLPVAGNSTKR